MRSPSFPSEVGGLVSLHRAACKEFLRTRSKAGQGPFRAPSL
ncbi:hypothetical protein DB31_4493 [Hyalangium minutum]|uniref:Uncharacterized protein n=1 Tax=Hyalangium minutum TaxID=394096 RepID=A0A085W045_9BACT|nr:hypothetical protein DB31_4493 [Hyalangium minutum]